MTDCTRVLFMASDPTDWSRLRTGEELRRIKSTLRESEGAGRLSLRSETGARAQDLSRAVHDSRPHVLHFSGHGAFDGAICFEGADGKAVQLAPEELAGFFAQCSDHLDCVILNACYSAAQAESIRQHIPFVIGIDQKISDAAAISFSLFFYQALAGGRDIPGAYESADSLLSATYGEEELRLVLKHGPQRIRSESFEGEAHASRHQKPSHGPGDASPASVRIEGDVGTFNSGEVRIETAIGIARTERK